jgi:hypothetical protein
MSIGASWASPTWINMVDNMTELAQHCFLLQNAFRPVSQTSNKSLD